MNMLYRLLKLDARKLLIKELQKPSRSQRKHLKRIRRCLDDLWLAQQGGKS